MYTLPYNESYNCVIIHDGGELYTAGHALTITEEDGLTVHAGAILYVNEQGVLRLDARSDSIGHLIDGRILIDSPNSIVNITQSTILRGKGSIELSNATALVQINPGKMLTNRITLAGYGAVSGLTDFFGNRGILINEHRVEAALGVLILQSGLAVDGISGAVWCSGDTLSCLRFERTSYLHGDFDARGTIELDDNVEIDTPGSFFLRHWWQYTHRQRGVFYI